jgi:hypothetical protein
MIEALDRRRTELRDAISRLEQTLPSGTALIFCDDELHYLGNIELTATGDWDQDIAEKSAQGATGYFVAQRRNSDPSGKGPSVDAITSLCESHGLTLVKFLRWEPFPGR